MGLLLSHKCTLSIFPDMVTVSRETNGKPAGGGKREEIEGFSRESRKRLFELMHKLQYKKLLFITLTYPGEYPHDWKVYKGHLRAFRARFERKFGKIGVVWRLEYQKRGAPHYHLLVLDPPFVQKEWVSQAWYEVVGSGDVRHLHAGTNVEPVDMEAGGALVAHYIGKYMSKEEAQVDEDDRGKTGRHWGRWNVETPSPVTFVLEDREAERITLMLFSGRGSADTWRPSNYTSATCLGDSMGGHSFGDFALRLILEGERAGTRRGSIPPG